MALESSTYISGLVVTNPTSSDNVGDGDNHIRLLKSTIRATFPNITGAVTSSHTAINSAVVAANGATSANTASKIVARDSSGNFSAGTISAALTGNVTGNVAGNASTSTRWATARTISLTGDVSGSATIRGDANANISVTIADDSHNHTIANVDGLSTALSGKVDDSQVLTNVPSGAVFTDTTYSVGNGGLTQQNFTNADHTKLNGIEPGANITDTANVVAALTGGANVSIASNGTISSTDTNTTYSVGNGGLTEINFTSALNSKLAGIATNANRITNNNQLTNGAGYVTTDTNTTYSVGNGGLTQINFTSALNSKLSGIAAGAQVNPSNATIQAAAAGCAAGSVDGYSISQSATGSTANTIYFRT